MTRSVLAALALGLASCNAVADWDYHVPVAPLEPRVNVTLAPDPELSDVASEALGVWLTAGNGAITTGDDSVSCQVDVEIRVVTPDDPTIRRLDTSRGLEHWGSTDYPAGCGDALVRVVASRIDNPFQLLWLVTHELGHVFTGGGHVDVGTPSVMHARHSAAAMTCSVHFGCCASRADMQLFCDRFGCEVEDTMYCE